MSNEKIIFDVLNAEIKNPVGVYALMGNLKAESALNPKNVQNSYERKTGYTDETYTKAVDSGRHNFVRDSAGYGLAQWTYWSRKDALLRYAKASGKSIGDLNMQLNFLLKEIKGYPTVWRALTTGSTIKEISDIVMCDYERPANQSESNKKARAKLGENIRDLLKNETSKKKTTSEIADEVIKGLWGNGVERKERLSAAGYNYKTIQTAVNKKLKGA